LPKLRPYVSGDWEAVLDLCLRAFAPACEALERRLGTDLGWRTSVERYLRSLARPGGGGRLVVAEAQGSLVGVVHYEIERRTRTGRIGVSAVRPERQGEGIASAMYRHALDAMRAAGVKYATADTAADLSHAAARRAYEKVGFVAVPTLHYFMSLRDPGARVPTRNPIRSRGKKRR
jgi:GNAT superfamily N-acetyltransferase